MILPRLCAKIVLPVRGAVDELDNLFVDMLLGKQIGATGGAVEQVGKVPQFFEQLRAEGRVQLIGLTNESETGVDRVQGPDEGAERSGRRGAPVLPGATLACGPLLEPGTAPDEAPALGFRRLHGLTPIGPAALVEAAPLCPAAPVTPTSLTWLRRAAC